MFGNVCTEMPQVPKMKAKDVIQDQGNIFMCHLGARWEVTQEASVNDSEVALCALSTKVSKQMLLKMTSTPHKVQTALPAYLPLEEPQLRRCVHRQGLSEAIVAPFQGKAVTKHCMALTSSLSDLRSYKRARTTYCRPETSYVSALRRLRRARTRSCSQVLS